MKSIVAMLAKIIEKKPKQVASHGCGGYCDMCCDVKTPEVERAHSEFKAECFRQAITSLLEDNFLSKDFPHKFDIMKKAIVLNVVNEIVSMVEINFEQE